jgi:hypothetical protein
MFAEGSSPEPGRLGRTLSIKASLIDQPVVVVVSDRAALMAGWPPADWRSRALFGGLPFVDEAAKDHSSELRVDPSLD